MIPDDLQDIIRSLQNAVIQKLAPSNLYSTGYLTNFLFIFLTFESVDTLIVHLQLAVLKLI